MLFVWVFYFLRSCFKNISKLIKTSKGGYADYSTSKWSRRERPLTSDEESAVKANGLFNLKDFLPKKPTEAELRVIKEMFEASVDGEAYDMDRWGQYFKPAGMSQATGDPVARRTDDVVAGEDDEPAAAAPTPRAEAAPAAAASASADTAGAAPSS